MGIFGKLFGGKQALQKVLDRAKGYRDLPGGAIEVTLEGDGTEEALRVLREQFPKDWRRESDEHADTQLSEWHPSMLAEGSDASSTLPGTEVQTVRLTGKAAQLCREIRQAPPRH